MAVAGPDWGEATATQFLAQGTVGSFPVDYRLENRTVTIPLILQTQGAVTFDDVRTALQQKAALWQREGGIIKRETSIGSVYATAVSATLKLGGSYFQASRSIDVDAVLTIDYIPEWVGAEVELTAAGGVSSTGEVVTVVTPPTGDHPGPCRIVVRNGSSSNWRGAMWAIRSRHYSADASAAVSYAATDLTPLLGTAGIGAIGTDWTPVRKLELSDGTKLTHQGSYRVLVAASSTSSPPPELRLVWAVGDGQNPTTNTAQAIPLANNTYVLDLGEIRLDPPPVGTYQWLGQIQARGTNGGEALTIVRVWLLALDEYSGFARSALAADVGLIGAGGYFARDGFNQSAGALAGKSPDIGSAWTGAGDSDGFNVNATNHSAERTAGADAGAGLQQGRFAIQAGGRVNVTVQSDASWGTDFTGGSGVFARYVDISNFLLAYINVNSLGDDRAELVVAKRVAGTTTELARAEIGTITPGTVYTVRLVMPSSTQILAYAFPVGLTGVAPLLVLDGGDTDFGSSGALKNGGVGFWNLAIDPSPPTRTFDNFAAWTPALDFVCSSSGGLLQVGTDGIVRADEGTVGSAYAPVAKVSGDLPRLPPPGIEGRSVEVMVKASRGDLSTLPDPASDSITVQVFGRPAYLFVPEDAS